MPIFDDVLIMLEETAADGKSIQEVLGCDINGFCLEFVGEEGAKSFPNKWRS